jgi:hypothetical protein
MVSAADPLLTCSGAERFLDSNDHLVDVTASDDNDEIDEIALLFKMLEWMEIEGAIMKAYDTTILSLVQNQDHRSLFQNEEERETVNRVLLEVDRVVAQLMSGFFKEFNFACGVLNSLLVCAVFMAYPQHFWLLYLIEGLFLLPRNLYERVKSKPLNRVFSYLDYCWMMNTIALLSLIGLVLHSTVELPFTHAIRKELFVFMMGTACGPLMAAAITLPFVALLFHNIDTMTGLFIHIFPPMVAYTLRWYPESVHEAWPTVFQLDYLPSVHYFVDNGSFLSTGTVAGSAIAGYFTWFILYTTWMMFIGMNLPRKDRVDAEGNAVLPKYDTCFHVAMRGGGCLAIGKKFWGRSRAESLRQMRANHFEAKDLLVYMAIHATTSLLAILVLGFACFSSQVIHASFLVLLAVLCSFRGAKRYTYYTTTMYSRMLRKHFQVLCQIEASSEETRPSCYEYQTSVIEAISRPHGNEVDLIDLRRSRGM